MGSWADPTLRTALQACKSARMRLRMQMQVHAGSGATCVLIRSGGGKDGFLVPAAVLQLRSRILACSLRSPCATDLSTFTEWLKEQGEHDTSLTLDDVGVTAEGRALFTSQPVKLGECALRVSKNLIITPKRLPQSLADELPKDMSGHGLLAVFILLHQHANEASPWAPYIRCLPAKTELQSTIFWTADELELVRLSPVFSETFDMKSLIAKEFSSLVTVVQNFPDLIGEKLSLEAYSYAYAVALSRCWEMEKLGSIALIPFADFLNHSAQSHPLVYLEDKGCAEVIADKDYPAGSQMHIRYGRLRNCDLALGFGFTLPHNIHDEVGIWIEIPPEDPLGDAKLELWHKYGGETQLHQDGSESGGRWFRLREIPTPAGMGKGLPQELRAFARMIACNSLEELGAMGEDVRRRNRKLGQVPFKDGREGRAMSILFSLVDTMVKAYTRDIKTAEIAISESRIGVERGEMALSILYGELRVLQSVRAWLRPRAPYG